MDIQPIAGKVFGASITDVKLAHLSDDEFAQIHRAFLQYGFLVFPDQFLTDAQNVEFGERFGSLEFGAMAMSNQQRDADGTLGEVLPLTTQRMRTNVGNEAWHTDSTYMPISSKCAMLSALVVPQRGGETDLADMRAGYANLDQAKKDEIDSLAAYHSTQYSQAYDVGDFPPTVANSIYHGEAYLRPLVKVHSETGVKNLFVGRHAFAIPGLSRQQSRELLTSLLDFVVAQPARVYRHVWSAGETMIWDNRCLLHRARPYDYAQPRVLVGTRVAGDAASELAYYPDDPAAQGGREALATELSLLKSESAGKMYG